MESNEKGFDILNFIITNPETVWMLALLGAVCVVGMVDYLKCFFEKKKCFTRWVVLILSLLIAVILSPITPQTVSTIIIIWLLVLSLATIAKKHIMDGIGNLINKITGGNQLNQFGMHHNHFGGFDNGFGHNNHFDQQFNNNIPQGGAHFGQ